MVKSIMPHLLDARTKGSPSLGSGAIFPVPESDVIVADFPIPKFWKKIYALDVGWNKTAAVWGAIDPETKTCYLYSEYYRGKAEPSVHAAAIRARGEWIEGTIDSAANGRSQGDGSQLMADYIDLGLNLTNANKAVEAGLYKTWEWISNGKLKVFKSLGNWRSEYLLYSRDIKGNVIKTEDHLMDATRYLVMTGYDIATIEPKESIIKERKPGWMRK